MAAAHKKERRISDRKELSGLLPGPLFLADDRTKPFSCKPVDISRNGLGVIADENLLPGACILLVIKDTEISLSVAWKSPDFGKQDRTRYGLITLDPHVDLEAAFSKAGCLKR